MTCGGILAATFFFKSAYRRLVRPGCRKVVYTLNAAKTEVDKVGDVEVLRVKNSIHSVCACITEIGRVGSSADTNRVKHYDKYSFNIHFVLLSRAERHISSALPRKAYIEF